MKTVAHKANLLYLFVDIGKAVKKKQLINKLGIEI